MRNLLALSLAALAACSYTEEKPGVAVHVDGLPQNADHLEATLTDVSSPKVKRTPVFGPGSSSSIDVVFPEPAAGAYQVDVTAFNRDNTTLAQGSATATFPAQADVQLTLRSSGVVGTYGAPCNNVGGSASQCLSGLECKTYQSGDLGVCTRTCASAPDCNGISPAATCDAFPGGAQSYCQWDCTAAGQSACPTGLTCRLAPNSGGKSYCQGT